MYDHILIPTDGSIETEQAFSLRLGLARTYDATVHVLYVTDESKFSAVTTSTKSIPIPVQDQNPPESSLRASVLDNSVLAVDERKELNRTRMVQDEPQAHPGQVVDLVRF